MAQLDPRLLGLIETLVQKRLDWLAFELVEAIQAGRAKEEPETALAAARVSIRSDAQPKAQGEPQTVIAIVQPIEGDAQIEWAATYVAERLDAALAQLGWSMDGLDAIIDSDRPLGGHDAKADTDLDARQSGILLVDDVGTRKSGRDDVVVARASVPSLRTGLAVWSAQARGQVSS
ncbi:hypothetical protein FJ936_06620 [Mesorhizobium sp. B2-4-13]|uniref:hypothetical protein n=1 Tax=Mesorhizobium sp. B2-4-13 TaxID=2589936 RepID=UPI001151CC2A|nr:hypothetical protein [Mesorhizobium sp. B2-4-13]TPK87017.1 hypothetical protein FJ936_06620 [Mesorhizobium sp. B2-4-13]